MMKKSQNSVVIILILLVGVLLYSYFSYTYSETKSLNQKQSTTELQGTLESAQPDSVEELDGKLVKDFPQIPAYKDATLQKSSRKVYGDRIYYLAQYSVPLSDTKAMNWYKVEFEKNGWKLVESPSNEDVENDTLKFYKGFYLSELHTEEKIVDGENTQILTITVSYDQD